MDFPATLLQALTQTVFEVFSATGTAGAEKKLFNFGKLLEPESMTGLPIGLIIVIPLFSFLVLFFYMEARRKRWAREDARRGPQPLPVRKKLPEGHLGLDDLSDDAPREKELKFLITSCRSHARWYPIVIMGGGLCLMAALSAFADRNVTWMDHGMLMAGVGALMWFSRSFQTRRRKRRTIDRLRQELHEETGKFYPGL